MNRSKIFGMAVGLGMAAIIGVSGAAFAYPGDHRGGGQAMTQEQQAVAQEIYADHDKQTLPLRQQLMAKRAELNSLYYAEKSDSSKAQSLYREIADIQAKLYSANADLRKKLSDKGIAGGGFGMYHRGGMNGCPGMNGGGMHGGHGMNGGYGGGHGGGRGMHGNGHW